MRNKHKFQYRGKRTRYMNDVRQHNIRARAARSPARFAFTNSTGVNTNGRFSSHGERYTNRRFFAHCERHTTTTAHSSTNIRDSLTRRTQVHSKKPHHAFMTFVVPPLQDIRPSDEEGELPTEVQPTTIRRRDEGARPQVVANVTPDQDTSSPDSSFVSAFVSPTHTYVYPSFPPNKTTEQLDEERTLALQALKEWDGIIRDTEIKWIQHYIDLAHLESQTQPHVTPFDKFEHLFTALSPFFLTKGEGFLFDHFDMKEEKIVEIINAIHPVYDNALIYAVPLKVASEGQLHQPFYSIFTKRIEQLVETTTTTLKNLERELDSFPSFDIATMTRSKKKTTEDKKKKKKKKKRNARRKSSSQYDSDSSSSSSSSSDSSSSTTSSSDSDDESTVAYNNIGTKANAEMSFSSNPKERKHQTSKVAKVLKRLHESAKQHHLSEYSVTRGTIDKRKSYFRTWIETLKHIFFLDGRYSSLLAKYPLIDCSNISTTSNMALSQFLFTKLEASSRDQVRSCLNDHLDGIELLKYLQQNYGATTIMDCTKALQRLKDTTWEYQDTVDTFSNRFLRRAETYRVMHQMRHLETINLNNTTSTRQSYNKVRPRNQSRPPYVKANAAAESTKPSNQANLVTQSRKFKPVKCWGCGHHHNLRDCPTTSDKQKQALYQQKREEKERRTNGQPNRSAHQQANKADTPKSEATPTIETSNPKNAVHKVTEMPRRRGTNFAAPVQHFSAGAPPTCPL
ncbi:hypothetical protein IV203_004514 [Nitzschia inconspicua]|uniref:Uncharacterized protein n=1 Tax=Nitzschia inconspicua TaxID=303405 RepID=A0A9K3L5Q9_9STRA|nr:hypothetical protein IV203_004514 [Nitzschia inconspicua]